MAATRRTVVNRTSDQNIMIITLKRRRRKEKKKNGRNRCKSVMDTVRAGPLGIDSIDTINILPSPLSFLFLFFLFWSCVGFIYAHLLTREALNNPGTRAPETAQRYIDVSEWTHASSVGVSVKELAFFYHFYFLTNEIGSQSAWSWYQTFNLGRFELN